MAVALGEEKSIHPPWIHMDPMALLASDYDIISLPNPNFRSIWTLGNFLNSYTFYYKSYNYGDSGTIKISTKATSP